MLVRPLFYTLSDAGQHRITVRSVGKSMMQYEAIWCNNLFSMTNNHYLNLYQNPVDASFVFIRWSNLYIFQTSIASISSSFVDEGGVLWFNSKCISRLTLSFVL